jgi:hypothetical protein
MEYTSRNEHFPLSEELAELFQKINRAYAVERGLREGERGAMLMAAKREAGRAEARALRADPGEADAVRKQLEAAAEAEARATLERWPDVWEGVEWARRPPELMATGMGEFWWGETNWWAPGGGIEVADQSDGLHFFGIRNYNSDPLWSASTGMVARFGLDPARRPPSASGRYASLPFFDMFGTVRGWANLKHCPFACDDKWSKCWLHTRQTVWQPLPGGPVTVGQNERHDQLIFLEGTGFGAERSFFGLTLPPVNFGLANPNFDIIVDIEVRFDMQLEGSSFLSFSPQQNPAQSVVVGVRQWSITVV